MSLLNDVLRDLQAKDRRAVTVPGLEAVPKRKFRLRAWFVITALLLAGLLASAFWLWPRADQDLLPKASLTTVSSADRLQAAKPSAVQSDLDAVAASDAGKSNTRVREAAAESVIEANPDPSPDRPQPSVAKLPTVQAMGRSRIVQATAEPLRKPAAAKNKRTQTIPVHPAIEPTQVPVPAEPQAERRTGIVESDSTASARARRLLSEAQRNIRRGRLRQAVPLLEQAKRLTPEDETVYRLQAAVFQRLNRAAAADVVLVAGLDAIPENVNLINARVRLRMGQGDLNGAIGVLRSYPAQVHTDPALAGLFAGLLQRAKRFAEALPWYRELTLRPDALAIWWMGYAISLEQTGHGDQAAAAYQKALAGGVAGPSRLYGKRRLKALQSDQDEKSG